MLKELLDLVPAAVTAIVGIVTITLASRNITRQLTSSAELARREREQQRKQDAYFELLLNCTQVGNWAQTVSPFWETAGYEPSPLPPADAQARAAAYGEAFGSAEVLALLSTWRDSVRAIQETHIRIEAARDPDVRSGREPGELHAPLEADQRPAEKAARDALSAQIRAELSR